MKKITLQLPSFAFIVATRAALAFGAGLLASARIPEGRRRAIGLALVAVGAASTVPALMTVKRHLSDGGNRQADGRSALEQGRHDAELRRQTAVRGALGERPSGGAPEMRPETVRF